MAMADADAIIIKCVDDIWKEYDKDGSGRLDKEETRKFVQDTLSMMSGSIIALSDVDFDAGFKDFDKNGSGVIEKDEMVNFIKKIAWL